MAVGEKTRAAELPEEVVRGEILTRLPVKSVLRFKCVSKSWLSLFSNPRFAKEHLTRNPNDYDYLIARKHNTIVILSRYKETFALPSHLVALVGSVRGLVCLCDKLKLTLWNPAIHQSKELLSPRSTYYYLFPIGFGFDPVSDNYKVVVLSSDLRSASVYYSNSDSWIHISVPDYVFRYRAGDLRNSITIVKDCPHWTFCRYEREPGLAVSMTAVKFYAGSNEFKVLPEFHFVLIVCGGGFAFSSEFVDMNDCLTVIMYGGYTLNIYSLDGEKWSKMYGIIRPLNFNRPHSYVSLSQGFYGGEIVFHEDGMFSCYDGKTDTIKRLSTTFTTSSVVPCFRYMPSLLFLQGMKSVRKQPPLKL